MKPHAWLLVSLFSLLSFCAWSQNRSPREIALSELQLNPTRFDLTPDDVRGVKIVGEYASKNTGVTHIWLQQTAFEIPIARALMGLHVGSDGVVHSTGHRFIKNLSAKINTDRPSLDAQQAIRLTFNNLGLNDAEKPVLTKKIDSRRFQFEAENVAESVIDVQAVYLPVDAGDRLRLTWQIEFVQKTGAESWSVFIDAQNGRVLERIDRTLRCQAGHSRHEENTADCALPVPEQTPTAPTALIESYRVFPLPVESPNHGARELLVAPADLEASPFGWLDTNGVAGGEFSYTRGNNAWAYDDSANDNVGSVAESAASQSGLVFDFTFIPDAETSVNRNAGIANLFYMTNAMHDWSYHFGFDEEAGNYQQKNYSGEGAGGDPVNAQSLDGNGVDNAQFFPSPDGGAGRMEMFKWSRSGGKVVTVNTPNNLQGLYYAQAAGNWGAPVTTVPITADVVFADDGTALANYGCDPLVNDVQGKIVMVDRGECTYGEKALNAQNKGAVACIICNFSDNTVGMSAGAFGGEVDIPVLMLSKGNCDIMRQYAGQGLNVTLVQPQLSGPDFLDGSFDNGVIAHEYAHGISNRLTGGPETDDCLENAEQMGEGWSDFFATVLTHKPENTPETVRGIATYGLREATDGTGIRRYPYSTDMSVNPLTFGDVAESNGRHAIGEIWAATLWDLYWAMVDQYGYDPDWSNHLSGNARTAQLVMDGLKYQPCSPGFIDGRNAIVLADKLLYGGADTCLISKVFARRGMGVGASQGSNASSTDGVEDFEPVAVCVKELKIKKTTTTPTINAGDVVSYRLTVTNHKDSPVTQVTIVDELPQGLTLISAGFGGTQVGNTVVWNLGEMFAGQTVNITYTASSDPNMASQRLYRDIMDTEADWFALSTEGNNSFYLQNNLVKAGSYAFSANDLPTASDMTLEKQTPLWMGGSRPTLRFWNRFDTQTGSDAGFLEFRKNENGQPWVRVSRNETFRNGYTGGVAYIVFAIPDLSGFSGTSQGWQQAYVDLSQFAGQEYFMRFRFGTNDAVGAIGWTFDDLELLDLVSYEGQACVTSGEGDHACARAPQGGVIVNPAPVGVFAPHRDPFGLQVWPNPADDRLWVSLQAAAAGPVHIQLLSADGREIIQRQLDRLEAEQPVCLDTTNVPAGVYHLRFETAEGLTAQKVVIR